MANQASRNDGAEATERTSRRRRPALLSTAAWVILALVFLGVIILDAFFSDSGILQVWHLERDYNYLLDDIETLEQENEQLRRTIEALESDPAAVEGVAREELNMIKQGEDVYLFPREPSLEDVLPPRPQTQPGEEKK
jgi:cell division protein FtsB